MTECMETCNVGVPCPHGKDCDHIGSGRLKYELKNPDDMEDAKIIYNHDDMVSYDIGICLILVDKEDPTISKHEPEDDLNTCVNDHTGCTWNNGNNGCALQLIEVLYG